MSGTRCKDEREGERRMRAGRELPRMRKARMSSVLSCGHYVLTGTRIVNRGDGWVCITCALAAGK